MAKKTVTPKVDPQETVKTTVATASAARKEKEANVIDPRAAQKKAEEARRKESANAALKMDIFSADTRQQAQDLQNQIVSDQKELEEIHGIDAKATAMVDMINAHNSLMAELDQKANAAAEEREKNLQETITDLQNQIDSKKQELVDTKRICDQEAAQYKKDLEVSRKREQAEHDYALQQTRLHEDDARKAAQAKEDADRAEREAALDAREKSLLERESKQSANETALKEALEKAATSYDEGKAAGKKEAETAHGFETRYLKKEHEVSDKEKDQQIKALTDALSAANEQLVKAQAQAEAAQTKLTEVMLSVAQNSGKTMVLGGSDNGTTSRK